MGKIKLWLEKAGFTSLAYFAVFCFMFIMGHKFLAGAALGIFVYINWNVIVKIWKEEIKPEVEKMVDEKLNK